MEEISNRIKCTVVVVGDAMVGKSALIHRLIDNSFHEKYSPTDFDKLHSLQVVEKQEVEFVIWDTSGSPAHDSVRALSYQEADVFLLCYNISNPTSLYNIKDKWIKELRTNRLCSPPVVLCGCQGDLRSDPDTLAQLGKIGRCPTTADQALSVCCEIGAVNYVETSAKVNFSEEVAEAFEVCALAAMKHGSARSPPKVEIPSVIRRRQTAQPQEPPPKNSKRKSILMLGGFKSHADVTTISSKGSNKDSSSTSSLLNHKPQRFNVSFSESEGDSLNGTGTMMSQNSLEAHQSVIYENDCYPPRQIVKPLKMIQKKQSLSSNNDSLHQNTNTSFTSGSSFYNGPSAGSGTSFSTSPPINRGYFTPMATSTGIPVQQPSYLAKRTESEDIILLQMPSAPTGEGHLPPAHVRSNGLCRRTSFRAPISQHAKPVKVASPVSPPLLVPQLPTEIKNQAVSPLIIDLKRQEVIPVVTEQSRSNQSSRKIVADGKLVKKTYESIKSLGSTASQGSTGSSKISSSSGSDSLGSNAKNSTHHVSGLGDLRDTNRHLIDPDVPDTEDPELLNQLRFTSPKAGVFRPMADQAAQSKAGKKPGKKGKPGCSLM